MSEAILEVENLVKNYGSTRAVDGISFSVPRGKVVGFLGPNGAGKTTTIQILLGITERSSGSIKYFGEDFFRNRQKSLQRINFASAFNTLLGRISVYENLIVFAGLYQVKNPKKRILELAEYFEIADLLSERYWDISSGQKTRVNLMKSLLNDPELILMDEPTASLDPDIADKTLTLIENLRKSRNLSILYTSHNMDEITRICDEVIFLDHGIIVAQDTPLNLTKRITGAQLRLIFDDHKKELEDFLKEEKYDFSFADEHTVIINTKETLIPKIIFGAGKRNIYITDIEVEKPTLEDVFLQIARKEKNVN
ncbi:MAG TPA: ABC transporter ATP-binding protein [Patescibacteria group bacterium]|nr:ABC transporter ATP-binding protein [Patescibacteria group bacterium]